MKCERPNCGGTLRYAYNELTCASCARGLVPARKPNADDKRALTAERRLDKQVDSGLDFGDAAHFLPPETQRAPGLKRNRETKDFYESLDKQAIIAEYQSGKSMRAVGQAFGIDPGSVCRILNEAGVQARPQGYGGGGSYRRTQLTAQQISAIRADKRAVSTIAKEYRIGTSRVYAIQRGDE